MPQIEIGRGTNGQRILNDKDEYADAAERRSYGNGVVNGGLANGTPNAGIERAGMGYSSPVDPGISTPARNF